MALILPQNLAPPADPAAARLEATLASLPDDWTLLPDRQIGGADGPQIGFILVHPEIGIALVDLLPAGPADGIARLRDLLAAEHVIDERDVLPVVAVALGTDEIPGVGERLAEAFDAVPDCDIADHAWPRRVIGLLLDAEDAAMSPLPQPPERAFDREPAPDDEPPFAAEEPALLSTPARRHVTFAAACAAVIAVIGIGGAGAYLLIEQPAQTPMATTLSMPLPQPAPPAPKIAQTPAPAPLAPAPVAVEPRPAPEAPRDVSSLAAANPAPAAPAVADLAPPQAINPISAAPAPDAIHPPPHQAAEQPPAPALSKPRLAMTPPSPVHKPPPAKPVRKDVASAANQAPPQAKQATKRVASLEPRARTNAETESDTAPSRPTASPDAEPPLDAGDLPPLEGSTAPPMVDLPVGSPVPLPAPHAGGAPAPGMPVMLLPPITAPVAMPAPPASGPNIGGLISSPGPR